MSKKIAYFFIYAVIFLFSSFAIPAEADSLDLIPPVVQHKKYPLSVNGFHALLLDLYELGTEDNYTIQFDGSLDLSQSMVGSSDGSLRPTFETINFAAISANLNFKGNSPEAQLTLPNHCFFGQNIRFEELTLQAEEIYGNGHQLLFENIRHLEKTRLFGGSDRDLVGNPKIVFQQVIGGAWEIYGGNDAGTLTGDSTIQVLDLTGDITKLCGGSRTGRITGNVTTEIKSLNGSLESYFGGGFGSKTAPVEISGEITNLLTSSSENFTLGNFVGGVAEGKTGAITTVVNGNGVFSSEGVFIGGSQSGEIAGKGRAITTHIDTRRFQKGERSFVGGNQYGGLIFGDIENRIHAGYVDKGSFKRIDGAGGMDIPKISLTNSPNLVSEVHQTDPQQRTPEEAAYDQLTSDERFSLAKNNTNFLVYGNVATHLLGGCVSSGPGVDNSIRGAGFAGVINGKVSLILGEEKLIYSKLWGKHTQQIGSDPNQLPSAEILGSSYGFTAAAGGGDNRDIWGNTMYIKGSTELIIKRALVNFAYGGSFSGMVEGNCYASLHDGQVSRIFGAGGGCYRIYGDSQVEATGGKVENCAAAGSDLDRRMIGNAYANISGGEFLGLLAGSYGARPNHMIEGNVATVVRGGRFKKNGEATQIMGGVAKEGMISGDVSLKLIDSAELMSGIGVSAARPKNAGRTNYLGGSDKRIDFELSTENSFANLEVIGDGGTDAKSLISPRINMNIHAPNGNFSLIQGMIKNSYAGRLLHELTIDIQTAQSVKAIVGSDLTSFTNRLIENSTSEVTIKLGAAKEEIPVQTIDNFTHLIIENKISAESILNGSGAADDNFEQNYHQFGELILAEKARLAVKHLKTGTLLTAQAAELHSPAGAQNIFLRKLIPKEKLTWRLLSPEKPEAVKGQYFDQQKGYPVMNFAGNDSELSPANFIGFDESGYVYTGDFNNGTGLAVAATIVDYQVASPLGKVCHDLSLRPENRPLPLSVWGAATDKQGELIIPAAAKIIPTLKFLETDQFSFQQAEITASSGEKTRITENSWQPSGNYYYQLQAQFQQLEGNLRLLALPKLLDFGQQSIGKETIFYPEILGKLEIKDTRIEAEPWQLTLQAEAPAIGALFFQEEGQVRSLDTAVRLFMQTGSLETTFDDWNDKKGIFLSVPKEQQRNGEHPLTFQWTLTTKVE